jgi:hypothetical protein
MADSSSTQTIEMNSETLETSPAETLSLASGDDDTWVAPPRNTWTEEERRSMNAIRTVLLGCVMAMLVTLTAALIFLVGFACWYLTKVTT